MKYAPLGRTGVQVSCIGLGAAAFGVAPLAEDADRLVGRALDLGINLFDTANSYGNQPRFDRPYAPPASARLSAEEILGRALGARRREVILCSKVCEPVGEGPNQSGLSRLHIMDQVEQSLRRLRTDHIDVYYAHHADPLTPIEESVCAFDDLIRQGKIRYYALSTFNAWEMTEALWASERCGAHAPVCNQLSYSLANRAIEEDVIPACLRFGMTVTAFSPLGGGLLAGEPTLARPLSGAARWGYEGFSDNQRALARKFYDVVKGWGLSPAAAALAWLASRPAVSAALVGPESVEELEAAASTGDLQLAPALLEQLEEIGRPEPRSWY
ncbi:MAG TPA: aldo/keto reductase [Parvularculaceae bacterium]|nr:aldo/keto reductase [Parvularculaceae bacterium]HRX39969.1 aldo/keto reductase [Parvularculaceae bacterium]